MPPPSPTAAFLITAFLNCFHNYPPNSPATVSLPSSPSFTSLLDSRVRNLRYNTTATPKPLLLINPTHYSHLQASVVCSRSLPSPVHLRVRSGGHDYEGVSYASRDAKALFFVLDLGHFDSVDVDVAGDTVWVESGATLGELYYRTAEMTGGSRGFPAGICTGVGVGGHVTGGGYGNMIRKYGLSSDNVVDVRLVNVNGSVVDRSSMGEDLFWALLGGGGASFGVILSYKLKLVAVPENVTVFRVERMVDHENGAEVVYRWQFVAPGTDSSLFLRVLVQPVTIEEGSTSIKISVLAMFLGGKESLVESLSKEFPELGLRLEDCIEMSWIGSVLWWDGKGNGMAPEVLLGKSPDQVKFLKRKSDYVVKPIPREGFDGLWKEMMELGKVGLVLNPYGGRMSEIPATNTPFPHRAGILFMIQYSVTWREAGVEAEQAYLVQIRRLYDYMTPFVSKNPRNAYFNYKDFDIGVTSGKGNIYDEGKVYGVKYFGQNFERLVEVKTRVDPENFFRNEQSIPPRPRSASSAHPGSRTGGAGRNLRGALTFFFTLEAITISIYIF